MSLSIIISLLYTQVLRLSLFPKDKRRHIPHLSKPVFKITSVKCHAEVILSNAKCVDFKCRVFVDVPFSGCTSSFEARLHLFENRNFNRAVV